MLKKKKDIVFENNKTFFMKFAVFDKFCVRNRVKL